jgi:hypothetical protein
LVHERRRAFMKERLPMRMIRLGLWPETAAQRSVDVGCNAKLDAISRASLAAKEQTNIDDR